MSALPKALPPLKGRPRSLILDLIETMIHQLKAVVGFQEEPAVTSAAEREDVGPAEGAPTSQGKTKIADLRSDRDHDPPAQGRSRLSRGARGHISGRKRRCRPCRRRSHLSREDQDR